MLSFTLKSLRNFPLCMSLIVWLINLDWSAICRPSGCTVASGVVGVVVVVVVVLTLTLTSDDVESQSWMFRRPLTSYQVSLILDEVDFWQTLKSRDSITRMKFKNPAREILDILV